MKILKDISSIRKELSKRHVKIEDLNKRGIMRKLNSIEHDIKRLLNAQRNSK